jgi:hypothetical protein
METTNHDAARKPRRNKRTDLLNILTTDWPNLAWIRANGGQVSVPFLEHKRAVSICRLVRAGLVIVRIGKAQAAYYLLAPHVDAYCEGRRAHQNGLPDSSNPYRANPQADAWDDGYHHRVHNLTNDDD